MGVEGKEEIKLGSVCMELLAVSVLWLWSEDDDDVDNDDDSDSDDDASSIGKE